MSWLRARGLTRWLATPVDRPVGIQVEHTVPPADVVPARDELARVRARFMAETSKPEIFQDPVLIDALLDRALALGLAVLLRPSVPVVPGRTS